MLNQAHRPVGVKIPEGQINERTDKPDLTVVHMLPMEFFAAQYVEAGKLKAGLFVYSGGKFYLAPNGAQWLAGMKELSEKMSGNAQDIYDRLHGAVPEDVPTEDAVDIIAQATAEEDRTETAPAPPESDPVEVLAGP